MPEHHAQQFAHLSDPHLTSLAGVRPGQLLSKRALGYLSWRHRRRFEHRPEVLAALGEDLQRQGPLAQVLVTGDLTHIGLPQEFQQALPWLQSLGAPDHVALVPGNHDACVAASGAATFALWRDYLAGDAPAGGATAAEQAYPTLRVRGELAFIGVNTGVPKPPLLATGTAGAAQCERLATLLAETGARGLFRVVCLHHCPLAGREKWRKRLTDAPQVQAVLAEQGAELVLHGHGHRSQYHELDSVAGKVPVIAVPSASALGLHGREPAGYNRYRVARSANGWQLGIESRRYSRQDNLFAAGDRRELELRR